MCAAGACEVPARRSACLLPSCRFEWLGSSRDAVRARLLRAVAAPMAKSPVATQLTAHLSIFCCPPLPCVRTSLAARCCSSTTPAAGMPTRLRTYLKSAVAPTPVFTIERSDRRALSDGGIPSPRATSVCMRSSTQTPCTASCNKETGRSATHSASTPTTGALSPWRMERSIAQSA